MPQRRGDALINRLWDQRFTTENILDTLEATITCPPSARTLGGLPADGTR